MSKLPDVFLLGMKEHGWKVSNGEQGLPDELSCDVVIVGTGAGAGVTAEILTRAGLDVILLEEGPLKTSSDFNQKEVEAYRTLYQDSAARANLDNSVTILQGRCVGGTTVINWTSSFRTPNDTLAHWQSAFGLKDYTEGAMSPWFQQAETRLGVAPWAAQPNPNNELLRTGADKLGVPAHVIPRNVRGCMNLGSCGLGCPANAKQSMLVTTIPAALTAGARLFHQARAQKFKIEGGEVKHLEVVGVKINGDAVSDKVMRIKARHYIVSGGAINSPALLLRSDTPDPHKRLGKRTFLHPVAFSMGIYDQKIEGWAGAPQTIYTDHYLHEQPVGGPIGYKLEAAPLHPALTSILMGAVGTELASRIKDYANTQALLALMRDGFHPESPGGEVFLNLDGSPLLNYKLTPYVLDGFRRAMLSMAEIQFAAGAKQVLPYHQQARHYGNMAEARSAIQGFDMKPFLTGAGSAHVMGGCGMSGDEKLGVVQPDGTHWQVKNLSVHDGSIFPTSVGANPQLSIYGVTNRLATQLAKRLSGKEVSLV